MMRSMFSGVSGLRTHQTRMDVIGNNIANVNTVGFKSGRVTFNEVFSQTLKGSSAPDSATGRSGTNPMQIGLGVGISSIDTVMTRGSTQRTDNPTDLMIEGEGFFVVKGSSGDSYKFTRAGNFGIDDIGGLNLNGNGVCGWEAEFDTAQNKYIFDTNKQATPINFYRDYVSGKNKKILGAEGTSKAYLGGNLDSTLPATTGAFDLPLMVYDSLGNAYKANVRFTKGATSTTTPWTVSVVDVKDSNGNTIISTPAPSIAGSTPTVNFNTFGSIVTPPTDMKLTFTPDATSGAAPVSVSLDLSSLTMYATDSSVKPVDVNGYPPGNLVTFNVGNDGIITGVYSNGQQQPLGMVAVTTFTNPAGLLKVGENLFVPSTNSGEYTKGVKPGTDGAGSLNPGTLEMSNVDLSKEFTDMIVTQRGFQANSRIITTSDEMLQELVNLKR